MLSELWYLALSFRYSLVILFINTQSILNDLSQRMKFVDC